MGLITPQRSPFARHTPESLTGRIGRISMADCVHIQHHDLDACPGLTEAEIAFGEKVRSVGLQFSYGREEFHGPTIGERVKENFDNAKRYGNAEPTYEGRAVLR